MKVGKEDVEVKIGELTQQNKYYFDQMKKMINSLTISSDVSLISYFTTSLNISHDSEQESLCLGSYHIRNIGSQALTNPYLCIKLPENSPFMFSGRYVYEHFKQNLKGPGEWERIRDKANKEEYWLKPLGKTTIEPNETISFPNFQIRWSQNNSYAGSIIGIAYCDQVKGGISVLNPININGFSYMQEDENE
ncbi:MAG: hypothetical protein RR595_05170 [Lysinibacillus sp.]